MKRLPLAFNWSLIGELGMMRMGEYLQKEFGTPMVDITPMGVVETARCIRKIEQVLNAQGADVDYENFIDQQTRFVSQAAWFSLFIDCQNLTGKKAVVFGDNTHAAAMTKILAREMGIHRLCGQEPTANTMLTGSGKRLAGIAMKCSSRRITGRSEYAIAKAEPSAIFGTQMERHVGKRLDIPCGIAAPIHVQNFPIGYKPFLGYEGTNQCVDLVYNSFTLGMEDHLLEIFGGHDTKEVITKGISADSDMGWTKEGQAELNKIPGFVRGKVKRNMRSLARSGD